MTVLVKSKTLLDSTQYNNIKSITFNNVTKEYQFTDINNVTYSVNGVANYVFILIEQ